ncbi:class I glutamine amidotransferase-like protein [Coniochaeta sp. PMI_546]|nr:class I glutamine amidotransferase-like protein [Coniochaeta sp. PMI_546]
MSTARTPLGVLVFSKTTGFRHDSIPAGISAFQRLANQSKSGEARLPRAFTVTATEDASIFTDTGLSKFGVIVLLQTSGDFLTNAQLGALKVFVHAGGGVVAIHCASTGMPSDPWYGRMIGAVFTDHPEPQHGVVTIEDPSHGIIRGTIGKGKSTWHGYDRVANPGGGGSNVRWGCFDEWYNYAQNPRSVSNVHVLYSVDETTYQSGKHGQDHPIAWCQDFEGGRSFYTALGHFDEAYSDEAFLGQLLNAIGWTSRQID